MSETHLIIILYVLVLVRIVLFFQPVLLTAPRRRYINETIDSIVYAGVAALFLIHFVVRSFYIPSESMVSTLLVNDYILVNELQYKFTKPHRGEIAVFHPPKETYTGDKNDLIKRVVGIEDDVLEVKDGVLWRNGQKVDEYPYVREPIEGYYPPHRVKKGHVFMMGDNRNNSADSRIFGEVPVENFVGRAELIFWPPQRIGLLR